MYGPFRLIDLFAGAGGLTHGFTSVMVDGKAAFDPVWANDFDADAAATYNENFGLHCRHGDIVDILSDPDLKIPTADIVVGGPPCQGFSLLNKQRRHDARKQLWRPFMDVVERSGAAVFVMENVRQLLGSPEYYEIKEAAELLGFQVESSVLCAADYGVPQVRHRAFIIGSRHEKPALAFPPKRTHRDPGLGVGAEGLFEEYIGDPTEWVTVREAIGDLGDPVGTEIRYGDGVNELHFGRTPTPKSLRRYAVVPPGGNRFDLQREAPDITPACWKRKKSGGTDLFGRLWWDRPSVTIRTEFFKPEKGRYLHPEKHRPITHREAARLQTFPDDFVFAGNKIQIARQIGNAVPPLLAQAVARSAYALLTGDEDKMWETAVHEAGYEYA